MCVHKYGTAQPQLSGPGLTEQLFNQHIPAGEIQICLHGSNHAGQWK